MSKSKNELPLVSGYHLLQPPALYFGVDNTPSFCHDSIIYTHNLNFKIMSLFKKYAETHAAIANRETAIAKLLSYTGFKDANMSNGTTKERLSVRLDVAGDVRDYIIFADSVKGLPNMVPTTGITCVATIQQNGEHLNLIHLGIGA